MLSSSIVSLKPRESLLEVIIYGDKEHNDKSNRQILTVNSQIYLQYATILTGTITNIRK